MAILLAAIRFIAFGFLMMKINGLFLLQSIAQTQIDGLITE